ncbi:MULTISPECIES: ComEA family DNA-binding protein [Sphingobacterium]|uniref:ComEA family DNA-binding protein n=1 Tax=Sphingobacterium TaxID=28453 RepID=UPI0013DCD6F7|nr:MULTISPECIES: helix-hairpin-helix domain-containing protein [unclassified Sphingobacterium]
MAFRSLMTMFFLTVGPSLSFAQEEERIDELLLEQIQEELGEDVDVSEISEKLHHYLKNPLDLNTVSESELGDIFFLSPQQIQNLIDHRNSAGPFLSILELQAVKGFDIQLIERIIPFVRVAPVSSLRGLSFKTIMDKDESMLMVRYGRNLESTAGYQNNEEYRSRYLGDPNKYALRYRWRYNNQIRVAVNMEKDAGEPFFQKKQRYGFDFYSGHIEIRALNKYVKNLVLGDYALQFGQGLVSWNGLSFGKGAWIGSVARQGRGLVPYSSMNENNFQRGVAASIEIGAVEWIPFIAYNKLSGKVEDFDGDWIISSINVSGLHRTENEQSYRKTVGKAVYGSSFKYKYKRLRTGFTYMGATYDGTRRRGGDLRQKFDFEGRSLHVVGGHYNYSFRNYYFFGETAFSFPGGWATNNGVIASVHSKLSLFANYRNYRRDFHTIYGQSLGEGSQLANEKGIYTGLVYHPSRKIEWTNYIDLFQFPWLRYRVDAPSSGVDFLSQFTYTWYKIGKLTFRYRYRMKQENTLVANRNTNLLADVNRRQFRIDFQYKLSNTWRIRTRAEIMRFEKESTNRSDGLLCYQDAFWQIRKPQLQFNIRLAYFDTDDYNSRIYAYENDVLYASGFPMYYDKGIRYYFNIRYKIKRNLDIWTRYALTYYFQRETIGSGLDLIEGAKKTDLKVQIRWQW